jgi:YidC/Oxa1 family membrane protein insertase
LILHPITKRAQVNMMRFGKQMQAMKPEIDKLQEKFKHDPKKLQQEQFQLMREHGLNPFQLLGCLPMFLQVPIWIALYAMLYFAFDIRHEPAFFGVFQWITAGHWPFLADLSTGDHFFGEFEQPRRFLGFPITGLNVLPILMGIVLYIHQKYMTPPPTATMTPEQIQQQKIMRVMMVVMLPVFLYPAPAGLTLYIITSSIFGIVESKYVRSHVDQLDLGSGGRSGAAPGAAGTPAKPKPKPKKPDRLGRAYTESL